MLIEGERFSAEYFFLFSSIFIIDFSFKFF
jgi:hypothetical protein